MSLLGEPLPLVPYPNQVIRTPDTYTLNAETKIVVDAGTDQLARLWRRDIEPATALPLDVTRTPGTNTIDVRLDDTLAHLGAEGYTLEVTANGVQIRSSAPAGAFYGLQTLRQLLPTQVFSRAKTNANWTVPGVKIEDTPRFRWRGSMLDVCRHKAPVEFVKKYIDLLAQHKMNTFHWHLTEDQGWRIEIKRYPRLTEVGAWRANVDEQKNDQPHKYRYRTMHRDNSVYGGYYTQDEVREIVQYAAERFITVVPEIEMPGHATAAIAAYPELGNNPDKQIEVATRWGVFPTVFNAEDSTIEFLKNVLDEVIELFPSPYIHIGGDECPKDEWKASPRAQELIRMRGLKDEYELQSWFIKQIDAHLDARGRRLVGWSEIVEGGLAEGATVMSWLGDSSGIKAARQGQDTVMAPTSHTYLDYYQSRDMSREPQAIGGYLPLWLVYSYDPIPKSLEPELHKHVLGVQGQLWTEYMQNPKQVEYMAFPRICALSEVAWTQLAHKEFGAFFGRLTTHLDRLDRQDVNFRRPDDSQMKPDAQWNASDITTTPTVRRWDISGRVDEPGTYRITFQYMTGLHGLNIDWAELFSGERSLGRVDQKGFTGGRTEKNAYTFTVTADDLQAPITLLAQVHSDGGTDSNGVIIIERTGN